MDRAEHIARTKLYKHFRDASPVEADQWIWNVEYRWAEQQLANYEDTTDFQKMYEWEFGRLFGENWRSNDDTPKSLKMYLFIDYYRVHTNRDMPEEWYVDDFKDWYINYYHGTLAEIGRYD